MREGEWYKIGVRVDLDRGVGREREIRGSTGELRRYAVVERTTRWGEGCLVVDLQGWDTRNCEGEYNADDST